MTVDVKIKRKKEEGKNTADREKKSKIPTMILQDVLHVEHPDLLRSPLATHIVLIVVHHIGLWVGNLAP